MWGRCHGQAVARQWPGSGQEERGQLKDMRPSPLSHHLEFCKIFLQRLDFPLTVILTLCRAHLNDEEVRYLKTELHTHVKPSLHLDVITRANINQDFVC